MMRFIFLSILIVSWGMGGSQASTQEIITFGPQETKIIGSIPYSVIGRYKAEFTSFKGRIILDEDTRQIQSVYLEIDAKSIKSNHPLYDRLARSRRLLNTVRFPKIIFRSDEIVQDKNGYRVKGILEMHGIKRRMTFPFKVGIVIDQGTKQRLLDIQGNWSINRKRFNIVWNRLLDRGGIVVGDYFTVNWGIKVYLTMEGH